MNLIGATYVRASKLSSHASYVGWPDLNEFDFRPCLTSNPLHEMDVQVNNISVVQRHCLQICETYRTRSHEFGSCLVTSSSAMEALGSSSISWAPMGGGHAFRYRKQVYADDRYNDNILSFAYLCRSFLRLSCEKSVKSILPKNLHQSVPNAQNVSCLACK